MIDVEAPSPLQPSTIPENKATWATHGEQEAFFQRLCFSSCLSIPALNICPGIPGWLPVTWSTIQINLFLLNLFSITVNFFPILYFIFCTKYIFHTIYLDCGFLSISPCQFVLSLLPHRSLPFLSLVRKQASKRE